MIEHSLALVGFGNVGQAFARLLLRKQAELENNFGLVFKVSGIATGRHGMAIDPAGINLNRALDKVKSGDRLDDLSKAPNPDSIISFIRTCPANVLFEITPVNHETGQPAVEHLRTALNCGMHVVTANKGPVVHAYRELSDLARSKGLRFMFESTVMDGAPIFSLLRATLPAAQLKGFQGILNSCTNLLLGLMEQGNSFEEAIRYAQSIGIAETDPSADIDGWDAAIKVAALATVAMGIPLVPQQVERQGIRGITTQMIEKARQSGERWKLVCSAHKENDKIFASVRPQRVKPDSPLYSINGTSSYIQFELDVLPGLGIVESNPGPETTAYGLLADWLNILRGI